MDRPPLKKYHSWRQCLIGVVWGETQMFWFVENCEHFDDAAQSVRTEHKLRQICRLSFDDLLSCVFLWDHIIRIYIVEIFGMCIYCLLVFMGSSLYMNNSRIKTFLCLAKYLSETSLYVICSRHTLYTHTHN